ncbi:endolysin [Pantoea phage vB_PagM_LIET2]|uniref:Lysozyme n=1 Tax=Pantoea phage vB_PagM_LIET2 TaxID=2508071 RepID=A0A411AW72_9CAUD|nr:endolysin [Pantoea phage vB_PagM_LIET2]QAX92351.1 lysozyme [Pantoea phage vB_PagM_LIET2]
MLKMRVSDNGLRFTAAWEDFRSAPYFATEAERKRGIYTWGFGHTSTRPPGRSITREEGYALLREDLAKAEASVNKWAHSSINQAQFDALVDHVINNGDGSIVADSVAGDFDDMVRFGQWDKVRVHLLDFRNQRQPDGSLKRMLGLVRRTTGRQALFDGKQWDVAEKIGRAVSSV